MSLLDWCSAVNKEAVQRTPFENGPEGLLIMANIVLWIDMTLIESIWRFNGNRWPHQHQGTMN